MSSCHQALTDPCPGGDKCSGKPGSTLRAGLSFTFFSCHSIRLWGQPASARPWELFVHFGAFRHASHPPQLSLNSPPLTLHGHGPLPLSAHTENTALQAPRGVCVLVIHVKQRALCKPRPHVVPRWWVDPASFQSPGLHWLPGGPQSSAASLGHMLSTATRQFSNQPLCEDNGEDAETSTSQLRSCVKGPEPMLQPVAGEGVVANWRAGPWGGLLAHVYGGAQPLLT